jgi:hypothetical protein
MEFIGVYKKENLIGIIDLDEVDVNFLHRMFEQGYSFSKISKKLLASILTQKPFIKLSQLHPYAS